VKTMQVSESHLESFSSWLCFHEDDIIGYPGMCFHSPLARWLSEVTGHTYGVDGSVYGRGSSAMCQWRILPRWAVMFQDRIEVVAFRPMTGGDALDVLARVEMTLTTLRMQCRAA